MQIGIDKVKAFLPHRDPFLFIDSVEEINCPEDVKDSKDLIGSYVVAKFKVRSDLKILEGHFPGNPILPGVVQIEMMAQACAFSSIGLTGENSEEFDVETLLLGVEKSKFRKQVVPEMVLDIKTTMVKCRSSIASYDCEVTCNGEKVSEATILARLVIKRKES
jgi:3-hydroxyacyl-[acyl-carrier-protein] dehydratase